VVTWNLAYSKYAINDAKKLSAAGLKDKAQTLLDILEINPLQNPPPYEKLVGDLKGTYSRRINIQHRLVYEIFRKEKIIRILRMWTHYE
jgi:Txe/YoeB family toxin of toxin-antitoxin system